MTTDAIIDRTIGKEGGYSNHPADRGGPTKWGITEKTARRNGYIGPMSDLPRARAVEIYRREYVTRPGFDRIAALSPAVGEELIDTGINMGPEVPARWLQEWLNALNMGGTLYPDITEDADVGTGTVNAFAAFLKARGAEAASVMLKALNASQGERYKQLARTRAPNEAFVFGWLRTRVGL